MSERQQNITFKGNPIELLGPELKVGDKAPDFTVVARDMSEKTLADFQGQTKLIIAVPSLDTPVCDQEARRFNQEAASTGDDVVVLTVSMDLPFAQKRFCATAEIENLETLSDHRSASFGEAYGVLMPSLRLLARAVFVVDKDDVVRFVEYVPEVTDHPDYEEALGALGQITGMLS